MNLGETGQVAWIELQGRDEYEVASRCLTAFIENQQSPLARMYHNTVHDLVSRLQNELTQQEAGSSAVLERRMRFAYRDVVIDSLCAWKSRTLRQSSPDALEPASAKLADDMANKVTASSIKGIRASIEFWQDYEVLDR